jgi:hypothetical protein
LTLHYGVAKSTLCKSHDGSARTKLTWVYGKIGGEMLNRLLYCVAAVIVLGMPAGCAINATPQITPHLKPDLISAKLDTGKIKYGNQCIRGRI